MVWEPDRTEPQTTENVLINGFRNNSSITATASRHENNSIQKTVSVMEDMGHLALSVCCLNSIRKKFTEHQALNQSPQRPAGG